MLTTECPKHIAGIIEGLRLCAMKREGMPRIDIDKHF